MRPQLKGAALLMEPRTKSTSVKSTRTLAGHPFRTSPANLPSPYAGAGAGLQWRSEERQIGLVTLAANFFHHTLIYTRSRALP